MAHGGSEGLRRSIGTFQLTMFGVGATVGTGIFIVLQQAVPKAGPAVLISFVVAGIAAGLSAICYAEMAAAVPVSGSTYSYAYTTMGEVVAMGVAACLLLEYGVSMSATAIGWSGYLNKLLDNLFGWQLPHALMAAPWGNDDPDIVNLPAMVLIIMCALLLIRGASESATVNTIVVIIKLCVLAMFVLIAFTAFTTDLVAFAGLGRGQARRTHQNLVKLSDLGVNSVSRNRIRHIVPFGRLDLDGSGGQRDDPANRTQHDNREQHRLRGPEQPKVAFPPGHHVEDGTRGIQDARQQQLVRTSDGDDEQRVTVATAAITASPMSDFPSEYVSRVIASFNA